MRQHCVLRLIALVIFASACASASDLQQQLQDRYRDNIFLLRGFYSDDSLHYDATGIPMGALYSADWTVDGFVLVRNVRIRGQRLEIDAKRLIVFSSGHGFQFHEDTGKKKKKGDSLKIEIDLGSADTAESIAVLTSKVFLTNSDSLGALVPDYWVPCVSAGLQNANDQKYANCRFAPELLAVAGMAPGSNMQWNSAAEPARPNDQSHPIYRVAKGVAPPRQIFAPQPEFSDAARRTRVQGTLTLGLTLDQRGIPQNIRILSPLGCGLDLEAVRAVRTWKFKPAEQEGHGPVSAEIAVEVDFHLQ